MDALQTLVKTYDANRDKVGKNIEGQQMLAPIGHVYQRTNIEIVLNQDGRFLSARIVDEKEPKVLIPVTIKSAGRTGNPDPHPLCDKIKYVAPGADEKSRNAHQAYIDQMEDWAYSQHSHPFLIAILNYVRNETVLEDLYNSGVIKLKANGTAQDDSMLIRWRVDGIDNEIPACWLNENLFNAFVDWYADKLKEQPQGFDMIMGTYGPICDSHPKGVIPSDFNSKLISSNDKYGLVYRGRVDNATQALSIGYEASQKAHLALSWLVENVGRKYGMKTQTKAIVAWDPDGGDVPDPVGVFCQFDGCETPPSTMDEFEDALRHTMMGWENQFAKLSGHKEAVIAVVQVTAPGRCAITQYTSVQSEAYAETLADWDRWCAFVHPAWGVKPPMIQNMVNYAYGAKAKRKFDAKPGVYAKNMERLVHCRMFGKPFPVDIKQRLVERASRLKLYDDEKGDSASTSYLRSKILHAACAAVRKYNHDIKKEDYDVLLEPEKNDLSYQYGRLLAVYDKIEERALYERRKNKGTTNALAAQDAFRVRPWETANRIEQKVRAAYLVKLPYGAKYHFTKLIDEIKAEILKFPEDELNRRLDDSYLIGYALQREDLRYKANKEKEDAKQEQEQNEENQND